LAYISFFEVTREEPMGEYRKEEKEWSWEIFVACMFIGIGIGLLFNATGAATLIGMGVGFLLGSLVKLKRKLEVNVPKNLGGVAIVIVGILFILGGLRLLGFIPKEYITYLVATGLIALGITIITFGINLVKK